jgi:signal transduction histidine kinase
MMKLRSFRVRVALLAAGLSGLVLLACGSTCWALIYKLSLDRVDQEIRMQGYRELSKQKPTDHWSRINRGERLSLQENGREQFPFILQVKDNRGQLLFSSPDWPRELVPTEFPVVPTLAEPQAEPPRRRNHPPPDETRPPADDAGEGREAASDQQTPPLPIRYARPVTRRGGGQEWRIGVMGNADVTMTLGINLAGLSAEMRPVRTAFLVVLPLSLLLVALGSGFIAQRALRPVDRLTRTVERITARGLGQRAAHPEADAEFQRLLAVFNQMMDRLERSFNQAVRFSADAAHELKTPLAILQGRLEQAVRRAAPGSDEQRIFSELSAEVQRLKSIVQRLLMLARADAGTLCPDLRPVNLSELVEELCEDVQILAPQLEVRREIAAGVRGAADTGLLRQLLHNLADNAVKYNTENGWLRFRLTQALDAVRLTISNTGRSIPPVDREKVFDRFHRGDAAHNREVDGFGLGLSLSREIARAHGGDLTLDDSPDGEVSFTLVLPPPPAEAQ